MERLEYIDDYFKRVTIPEKESDFERRLLTDKEFAQEVAFYLSTIEVARTVNDESKKSRFKEIYYQNNSRNFVAAPRKLWPYTAMIAAVLAALVFGLYLYNSAENSSKLADKYLSNNLKTLSVQMGDNDDLIQQGRSLYNEGQYSGSLKKFEQCLQKDSANFNAKENAGIVALKMHDYNKAIYYFKQLSNVEGLSDNPGKFFQALTFMKRNKTGDKKIYTELLYEVVRDKLVGKEDAAEFLKEIN